jgi:hypothetical protein
MNDGATHKGDEGPIYFSYAGPTAIVISHYRTKAIPFSEMTKANLIVPARTSHAASFPCNFLGKKRKENKRSSSAFLRAGGAESISGVRSPSAMCALRRTVYAGPLSGFASRPLHDGSLTATYGWLLKRPSATYGWSLKTFSDP